MIVAIDQRYLLIWIKQCYKY